MERARGLPAHTRIVCPSDLRGAVTREVADAVRGGRARYVGFDPSQGDPRCLLDARLATLAASVAGPSAKREAGRREG